MLKARICVRVWWMQNLVQICTALVYHKKRVKRSFSLPPYQTAISNPLNYIYIYIFLPLVEFFLLDDVKFFTPYLTPVLTAKLLYLWFLQLINFRNSFNNWDRKHIIFNPKKSIFPLLLQKLRVVNQIRRRKCDILLKILSLILLLAIVMSTCGDQ